MMAVGYVIIGFPTPTPVPHMGLYLGITCVGLFVIAFGNGLFKGNLQLLWDKCLITRNTKPYGTGFQVFICLLT